MKNIIKPYKKEFDYSYAQGAYITVELLETNPDSVEIVYIRPDFKQPEKIAGLCAKHRIACVYDDAVFKKTGQKENVYTLGVFKKYSPTIASDESHVVLVNPGDMGNLGTIMRTLIGFDIRNLAIITPAADVWNPKTVRASMGSIFRMNFGHYGSFCEYLESFPARGVYAFMPDGEFELNTINIPNERPVSLVFGNEANGLTEDYRRIGVCVRIPQSASVDSLNLSVAVAVGVYSFTSRLIRYFCGRGCGRGH